SFNAIAGPYTVGNSYRIPESNLGDSVTAQQYLTSTNSIPTIEGGITQVSTTLFQAAFWSGLKIVERHQHPSWLERFGAGTGAQRGIDAWVEQTGSDLRIQNNTQDWIRIEARSTRGTLTVSIFG